MLPALLLMEIFHTRHSIHNLFHQNQESCCFLNRFEIGKSNQLIEMYMNISQKLFNTLLDKHTHTPPPVDQPNYIEASVCCRNCSCLSDRINSQASERPHKSFKAHISHGAKMMPHSALLSSNNRTNTHKTLGCVRQY